MTAIFYESSEDSSDVVLVDHDNYKIKGQNNKIIIDVKNHPICVRIYKILEGTKYSQLWVYHSIVGVQKSIILAYIPQNEWALLKFIITEAQVFDDDY